MDDSNGEQPFISRVLSRLHRPNGAEGNIQTEHRSD